MKLIEIQVLMIIKTLCNFMVNRHIQDNITIKIKIIETFILNNMKIKILMKVC